MNDTLSYSVEEVATLLAAYRLSDSGTFSVEEVRNNHPNSFTEQVEVAKAWLNDTSHLSTEEKAALWWSVPGRSESLKFFKGDKTVLQLYKENFHLR